MHEMSIARNTCEIALAHLPADDASPVKSVKVRIGELAGVVPESLRFCFSIIAGDSRLAGATLITEEIPATADCKTCNKQVSLDFGVFICPACGSTEISILSGTELQIIEIELNDDAGAST